MTTRDPNNPTAPEAKDAPETLELRARPQPVTRINRKVLIGGAPRCCCSSSPASCWWP